MNEDPNYIAKLEKAISEKYGKEAVQNPKGNWTEEKEEEYLKQLRNLTEKMDALEDQTEKVDVGGFLVSKKLLNKAGNKNCEMCNKYFFKITDDIYMNKYGCCSECYIGKTQTKKIVEELKRSSKNEKEQEKNQS